MQPFPIGIIRRGGYKQVSGVELLTNGDFESGALAPWTATSGTVAVRNAAFGYGGPQGGLYWVGPSGLQATSWYLQQVVSVMTYGTEIDAGGVTVDFEAWSNNTLDGDPAADYAGLSVRFLDVSEVLISEARQDFTPGPLTTWVKRSYPNIPVPVGTRGMEFRLHMTETTGGTVYPNYAGLGFDTASAVLKGVVAVPPPAFAVDWDLSAAAILADVQSIPDAEGTLANLSTTWTLGVGPNGLASGIANTVAVAMPALPVDTYDFYLVLKTNGDNTLTPMMTAGGSKYLGTIENSGAVPEQGVTVAGYSVNGVDLAPGAARSTLYNAVVAKGGEVLLEVRGLTVSEVWYLFGYSGGWGYTGVISEVVIRKTGVDRAALRVALMAKYGLS